jgi:pSer/pThr/pTyr-binding forkhead associated (FHA) protein
MKDPILILSTEGKEKKIPLNKEKLFLGRDSECDLVLEGKDFSRKHVAIHYKHGLIYVENISTSGEIKVANKATEYAELRQDEEVVIGNYRLKWTPHDGKEEVKSSQEEPKQEEFNSFGEQNSVANEKVNTQSSNHLLSDQSLSEISLGSPTSASGDIMMNSEMEQALSQEKTVQVSNSSFGMFRIISGEIAGREIKLEHGKEWIVGRAKECHVSINNSKLSRHHFKINQISVGFRIKDLDSSYGIKVNGVGVKEAPLKSLDVITAGPVEIQFIIADKNIGEIPKLSPNVPALLNVPTPDIPQQSVHLEKTHVPAVINPQNINANFGFTPSSPEDSSLNQKIENSQTEAPRKPLPKERIDLLIKNFKKLNKNQKALFALALVCIFTIILSFFFSPKPQPTPQAAEVTKIEEQTTEGVDNAAESSEFSPEYMLKTPKEQAKIQELYIRAEEARARGEWQRAFDISTEIIKSVNNYKRTKDILSEAQSYLTDMQIATLTKTPDDPESANLSAQQKIEELLDSGETALNEKRWEDAQEIYTKALLLDPKNETATRGQYAAQMKNAEGLNKKLPIEEAKTQEESAASSSSEASTPTADIAAEILQAHFEEVNKGYQDAKQKIQEGSFRDAYPLLKELKAKIESLIGEEEASRSISSTNIISEEKRTLRSKIIESMDLVNEQYVLEYKTQLDDAQQAKANQKLVEARAIYDSIIRKDPLFDEPRVEREKLYRKMIADGQSTYREALISESLGNVSEALELYEKAKSFFEKVEKKEAQEYFVIVDKKMRVLKK